MASSSSQRAQSAVSDEPQRWTKRMKEVRNRSHGSQSSMARRQWTKNEDMKLLKHVVVHGGRDWNILSDQLHGRSPDSCKVRWFNKWSPIINKKFGKDAEPRFVVREDDHVARKHTTVTSSAIRLPTEVESDSSTVLSMETPPEHGVGLNLSCDIENSLEIIPVGISMFNGISDVEEPKIFLASCHKCKRVMGGFKAKGKVYVVSTYDASPSEILFSTMNLFNSVHLANNNHLHQHQPAVANVFQPPSPSPPPPSPSTPKFIDFLGVGSI